MYIYIYPFHIGSEKYHFGIVSFLKFLKLKIFYKLKVVEKEEISFNEFCPILLNCEVCKEKNTLTASFISKNYFLQEKQLFFCQICVHYTFIYSSLHYSKKKFRVSFFLTFRVGEFSSYM